ncbi:MAG TPA: hypothetical protein VIU40_13910 [Geobacteraceae bacterium]
MPDFPAESPTEYPVFYTNVERWLELTGRPPSYASTARNKTGSVYTPVIVRSRFTLKKLWALNGATPGGAAQMALYHPQVTLSGLTPGVIAAKSEILTQAGISSWQAFDVPDKVLAPGLYFLAWGNDTTTATVQQLFAVFNAAAGELALGGIITGGTWPLSTTVSLGETTSEVVPILAMGGVA